MGLQLWIVFEAVSNDKEKVDSSLKEHVTNLEEEEGVEILERNWDETSKVENPHPQLDEGYSNVIELTIDVESFSKAVEITVDYGPTYVQIEGPENFNLDMKDSQEALQKVANTMHQYAQMGAGGVLISKSNE